MDEMPEDLINDDLEFFKYAPLFFDDVECTISKYKNLLSNNCHRFKFKNKKMSNNSVQFSM